MKSLRMAPFSVTDAELMNFIRHEQPGAISAYARCLLAARRGLGVRLTYDEVVEMTADEAITTAVEEAVLAMEKP